MPDRQLTNYLLNLPGFDADGTPLMQQYNDLRRLSGFFHTHQLQRLWSAFFLKLDSLLVRPHHARTTNSLLEMLVFLKCNSCLI